MIKGTKPLVRGTRVDFNGMQSIVIFRYEKLCDFCFVCGKLDRIDRDYPYVYVNESDIMREKRQFEPWLKVDGMKSVSLEEINRSIRSRGKQVMHE